MTRLLPAAAALGCALALGACDPNDLGALGAAVNSGQISPTLAPGQLTSANLAAAGFTPAQITKVTGALSTAQAAAKTAGALLCPVLPIAEGIANITLASAATSTGGQIAKSVVTLACNALASAPTYTGFAHRKGELVTAYLDIGRFHRVPVYGIRQ